MTEETKKTAMGIYTVASGDFQRGPLPGISRCLKANQHDAGLIERIAVASRGRNPDNPSDRTTGAPTEQRLEPNMDGVSNALTTVQKDSMVLERSSVVEKESKTQRRVNCYGYRIRKLTAKECWRLMSYSDEDFNAAAAVNSKSQLYKQAGNAIVENVLVAIFGQMIPGKENVYKRYHPTNGCGDRYGVEAEEGGVL